MKTHLINRGFSVLAIMFSLILPGECLAGGYSGQAAYNYAATYWDEVVSDGFYWIEDANKNQYCQPFGSGTSVSVVQNYINTHYPNGAGVDCAHFVSSCIGVGGGLSVPPQAPGQSYYGYAYAPSLVSWLISSGNGVAVSSESALQVGDVIGYNWDGNSSISSIDHVALYIGNGLIAAHSSCYWGSNWNFYAAYYPVGNVKYTFIHILTSALSPNMSLSYSGTAIPNGDQSPSAAKGTDFGTTSSGLTPISRTFTISNAGSGALNLTGTPRVQLGGNNPSDFGLATLPSTPMPANGGSTTFQLVFQPTANTGVQSATVTIANDDPNKNPYTFTVQGTAQIQQRISPSLEYSGATISEGDQSPTVSRSSGSRVGEFWCFGA